MSMNSIKRPNNQISDQYIVEKKQRVHTESSIYIQNKPHSDNFNHNINSDSYIGNIHLYDNNNISMDIVRNHTQTCWNMNNENVQNFNALMDIDIINSHIEITEANQLPSKHKGRTISDYCSLQYTTTTNKSFNRSDLHSNMNIMFRCSGCNIEGNSEQFLGKCNFCDRFYCIMKCLSHCDFCHGNYCIQTCSTLNYNTNNYVSSLCLDCCRIK